MTAVVQEVSSLMELIQRYRICWEVWPEYALVGSEKRQIGFALELSGTHAQGTARVQPGCEHCHAVFAALREVAESIVPAGERPSISDIGPYRQALHYSPIRQDRPEVRLTITILHQKRIEDPIDPCQVRCLSEMKQRLKELGAQERQWIPRKEGR